MEGGADGGAAGNLHRKGESWLQQLPMGRVEGESARKKEWDLGTGAVSWGRREQVATCLSAQLFSVQVPEKDRTSGRRKSNLANGPLGLSALAIGSETKAKPQEIMGV